MVAVHTLRRWAVVVDTTDSGDPVVMVGEHRLALPGHARHFRRFVHCALCGREFLGPNPVLSMEQLRYRSEVVCPDCSRPAGSRADG